VENKHFLVLEDNQDDAFLIRRAVAKTPWCSAFVCRNASEAKAYMLGAGLYSDRLNFQLPQMILLDLKLGTDTGINFLKWLKTSPEFNAIPVTVLTGYAEEKDVIAAENAGALNVLIKPVGIIALIELLGTLVAGLSVP
jgi:CheY-like chemotaxis protein